MIPIIKGLKSAKESIEETILYSQSLTAGKTIIPITVGLKDAAALIEEMVLPLILRNLGVGFN